MTPSPLYFLIYKYFSRHCSNASFIISLRNFSIRLSINSSPSNHHYFSVPELVARERDGELPVSRRVGRLCCERGGPVLYGRHRGTVPQQRAGAARRHHARRRRR